MTVQDLVDEFTKLKVNSQFHALQFLETSKLASSCHWIIAERLANFIRRLEAGGPRLRAEILRALGLRLPAEEIEEFSVELEGAT